MPDTELSDVLDAVLLASRTLVALSAQSVAAVAEDIDVVQLRVLVVVASRTPCTVGGVADALGMHVSTASRTCDRMVAARLLHREPSSTDRRNLELTLTDEGERLVGRILRRRRAALEPIVERLSPHKRRRLARALRDFAAAAGEPSDRALWTMGWTTEPEEVVQ